MYERLEEVPLVGMYRKELAGELLAMYQEPEKSEEEKKAEGPQKVPMDDVPAVSHGCTRVMAVLQ